MTAVYRYRELIRNLVARDLRRKYRDSVLGFCWSLLNPLAVIAVYNFAFKKIMHVPIPNYVLFLMVGIFHWNLFAGASLASTSSIRGSGGLIKKVAFPLEILPLSTVLFNVVQYLLAMAVFLPVFVLLFHVRWNASFVAFFPLLALQVVFTIGLSLLLSTATVFYQDVMHFTELAFMLLFWLSPVVYALANVPAPLRPIIWANPLTPFLVGYQDILIHSRFPEPSTLLYAAGAALASLAVGSAVFRRYEHRFAEEV